MTQLGHLLLTAALMSAALRHGDDDAVRPANLSRKQREFVEKEIVGRLGNADPEQRHRGFQNAVRLGATAVPFLLDLLKEATDPIPRRMAVLGLGVIGDPAGRGQVHRILGDRTANADEVVMACLAAGLMSGDEADFRRELRARLHAKEPPLVRRAAAVALARLRDREAVPELLNAREPIDFVRATLDLAVGLIGDANGISYRHLCADASQGNALVRRAALMGLCNLPRAELGKDDPLARPDAELRRRDELAEIALLAALSPRTAPLTLDLARAAEARKDRQLEDVLFAVAHAAPPGAVDYFLEAVPRLRGTPTLAPALLAAAALEELEVSRLQPLLDASLDGGDAASHRAAVLALFVTSRPLEPAEVDRLLATDADVETRRLALLVLAAKGVSDVAALEARCSAWPAADARSVAPALEACRATLKGVQDVRLVRDQLEEELRKAGGRFGYRLAARRDLVLASSLELDRLLRREDGRDRPPADGSGSPPKGGGSDGGGDPGDGSQGGAQDGKLGVRRRGLFQNERVEHDLRLFLSDYEYFPRSGLGAQRP